MRQHLDMRKPLTNSYCGSNDFVSNNARATSPSPAWAKSVYITSTISIRYNVDTQGRAGRELTTDTTMSNLDVDVVLLKRLNIVLSLYKVSVRGLGVQSYPTAKTVLYSRHIVGRFVVTELYGTSSIEGDHPRGPKLGLLYRWCMAVSLVQPLKTSRGDSAQRKKLYIATLPSNHYDYKQTNAAFKLEPVNGT